MGLVNFAFEDDAVVTDAVEANPVAEVVEASADATADAGEIAQVQEMVDTGIAEAGNLETVGDAVADTLEEGGEGLSPDAATQVEISVESICARLGMKNSSKLSVESFKSTASRRQATKLSLENIWDKLKKVWEAIKKTLANLWERIKLWFGKLNLVASATGKSAVNLVARLAKKQKDAKAEKATLSLKGVSAAFTDNGKCGVEQITAALKAAASNMDTVNVLITDSAGYADKLNAQVEKVIKSIASGEAAKVEVSDTTNSNPVVSFASKPAMKFVRGITGKVVVNNKSDKLSAKFEIQLPAKFEPAAEVAVCTVSEAVSLANEIRTTNTSMQGAVVFEKGLNTFKKIADKCISDLTTLIAAQAKKEPSAEEATHARELSVAFGIAQNELTVTSSLLASINAKVLDYAKNAITEALTYGYAVEAQYKDAE